MSNFSKIVIIILIVLSGLFINDKYGSRISEFVSSVVNMPKIEFPLKKGVDNEFPVEVIDPPSTIPDKPATEVEKPSKTIEKKTVDVYFLALDQNNNTVYKKVVRDIPVGEQPLEFAVKSLLKGPNLIEKSTGAYSEIPASTKLLSVRESKNRVVIDFSSDFQYGGGTDSIYSRLMQLIKTALANTDNKKIYLYLDGQQISIIGGEGIMITQPLSEKSLDL